MSVIQMTIQQQPSDSQRCKRCNAVLPRSATFCGKCGERVVRSGNAPARSKNVIANRYRVTSLICRHPFVQLSFALDMNQQCPVVIRDLDVSSLDERARAEALKALQQEHQLLHRLKIADALPFSGLHCAGGHLYSIAARPVAEGEPGAPSSSRIYTLHDLLQSGIGLPDEAIAVAWVARLAAALECLHQHGIVFEELGPDMVICSSADYTATPALMAAWLPERIRQLLPQASNSINTRNFTAPEFFQGKADTRSDIYSLGAILYLLLSGISPTPAASTKQPQNIIRLSDLNSRIAGNLESIVMQALASDPTQRIQSAGALAEALSSLGDKETTRRPLVPFVRQSKGPEKQEQPDQSPEEMVISSDKDNNETGKRDNTHAISDATDETVCLVPQKAGGVQRYLSRIHTQKLGIREKQSGEAMVNEVRTQEEPIGDAGGKSKTPDVVIGEDLVSNSDNQMDPTHQTPDASHPDGQTASREQKQTKATADMLSDSAGSQPAIADLPTRLLSRAAVQKHGYAESLAEEDEAAIASGQVQSSEKAEVYDVPTVRISLNEMASSLDDQPQSKRKPVSSGSPLLNNSQETEAEFVESKSLVSAANQQLEATESERKETALERFKEIVTGKLPALRLPERVPGSLQQVEGKASSFFRQVKRFILGEQQHQTAAAALIEAPMRIQPAQSYTIRIHIMGRDAMPDDEETAGLSALVQGDMVHIEVRSALYQNYAYIVQQADVAIPAVGYAAEVTMPMRPLAKGPGSRRERLHIFFMDAERNPLYEKPFVIELFISPLVQAGREGHNVLSIPL